MTSLADLYQRNRAGDLEAIPVQPEDTSSWWDRVKAAWASGGWQDPQPGQRGTFVPGQVGQDGKVSPAVPGIIQQPAESLQALMTAPLSDIVRSGDRDAIRAASEASFDVASMLPAAGVAATKAAPKTAGQRAMVAASNPDDPTTAAILAALPMDDAARMARAQEGGFDVDKVWTHYTPEDPAQITSFDPSQVGRNYGVRHGFHFTDDSSVGGNYGSNAIDVLLRGELINVDLSDMESIANALGAKYPKSAAAQEQFGLDHYGHSPSSFFDQYAPTLEKMAKEQGYTGYNILGRDGDRQAVVFDPSNIRSVNAAFDPAKKNSANLLASNPDDPTTAAILALLTQQAEKPSAGMKVYRGGDDGFSPSKHGRYSGLGAFSVSTSEQAAKKYGSVQHGYLKPDAKILDIPKEFATDMDIRRAKLQGYDAIRTTNVADEELIIINSASIQGAPPQQ